MRYKISFLAILFSVQLFGQWTKLDSVVVNKRVTIKNAADYAIGSDSIQEIKMVWTDGVEIDTHYTKKLIQRTTYKFYNVDSLVPYLKTADFDEKAEDIVGTKLLGAGYISQNYVDATGETTLTLDTVGTVGVATKYDLTTISGGSGLSAEQVFDTLAYSIRMGEGLKKTKSDTGDSTLIELKLKDALERIVWSTGCHKMVFMPTNTTSGTATWGFQVAASGTVTAPGKSTSSKFLFSNRWEVLVASAATTNVAGLRASVQTHGFGNAAGMGGFYFNGVAGPATGVSNSNARFFWGMTQSAAAPSDVDPSTMTLCFGIGYDDTDTNLQFMHNDGSGTCTKIDLGSNFPVPTSDRSSFWRLIMYAPSNTQQVYYKVIDMLDGDAYIGSVSTDLPAKTDIFGPKGYTSVGGTSAVTGFAVQQLEIFCDF